MQWALLAGFNSVEWFASSVGAIYAGYVLYGM